MKFFNRKTILSGLIAVLFLSTGFAQELELPRKSPKASISYSVGLTDITINYSSPSVRERAVWGKLVPWGKVWRAGANEATTVEFSTDVYVEGELLPAGKYSFFLIPKKEEKWTAIFNKVADQWGAYEYDESQDVLRVEVMTKTSKINEERLTYSIVDQAMDKGYIRFAWSTRRAYIRFKVEVMEQALANVDAALKSADDDRKWLIYAQAADFMMENEKYQAKALDMAKNSTDLFNHSWNWYVRAKAEARMEDYKSAVASAKKAVEYGENNAKDNFYKDSKEVIAKSIAEWEAKVQP